MENKELVEYKLDRLWCILKKDLNHVREILDYNDVDYEQIKLSTVTGDYEKELIQVAASALAALVDYRLVNTLRYDAYFDDERLAVATEVALVDILNERKRQDTKFKPLPRNIDPFVWLAVIQEELCEVAQEVELIKNTEEV